VGGAGRGRGYATQQINQAYAVLLSSQFQAYCRDLHSECAGHLLQAILPVGLRLICHNALVKNRKPDTGNPNPGNIGSDFARFELVFWDEVGGLDRRNELRSKQLVNLNVWRNAIAHQDFTKLVGRPVLRFRTVRGWRSSCDHLAGSFDEVMRRHIRSMTMTSPW
jgi:hypothetical protein